MTFKVIQGGETPREYRKDDPSDPELIHCPECDQSMCIPVVVNPRRVNGKWDQRSGTKKLMCAICRKVIA